MVTRESRIPIPSLARKGNAVAFDGLFSLPLHPSLPDAGQNAALAGDRSASCPCHSRTATDTRECICRWGCSVAKAMTADMQHDLIWPSGHEPFRPVQSARSGEPSACPRNPHDPALEICFSTGAKPCSQGDVSLPDGHPSINRPTVECRQRSACCPSAKRFCLLEYAAVFHTSFQERLMNIENRSYMQRMLDCGIRSYAICACFIGIERDLIDEDQLNPYISRNYINLN